MSKVKDTISLIAAIVTPIGVYLAFLNLKEENQKKLINYISNYPIPNWLKLTIIAILLIWITSISFNKIVSGISIYKTIFANHIEIKNINKKLPNASNTLLETILHYKNLGKIITPIYFKILEKLTNFNTKAIICVDYCFDDYYIIYIYNDATFEKIMASENDVNLYSVLNYSLGLIYCSNLNYSDNYNNYRLSIYYNPKLSIDDQNEFLNNFKLEMYL